MSDEVTERPISADRINTGRRETDVTKPASMAAIREGALFPPSASVTAASSDELIL